MRWREEEERDNKKKKKKEGSGKASEHETGALRVNMSNALGAGTEGTDWDEGRRRRDLGRVEFNNLESERHCHRLKQNTLASISSYFGS